MKRKHDNRRFVTSMMNSAPTYICKLCGKRTRETGEFESESQLCRACLRECQREIVHSDHRHDWNGPINECPECIADGYTDEWIHGPVNPEVAR